MQVSSVKIYKIRDKETGLYSSGGTFPRFTKKGKVWNGIGALKNHMNQFIKHYRWEYGNCEVVEYVLEETEISTLDPRSFLEVGKEKERLRREESEARYKEYLERKEREQLAELKKKYEEEV